jgi:hypothetical protein
MREEGADALQRRSRQKPRFLPAGEWRCPLKSPQAISAN